MGDAVRRADTVVKGLLAFSRAEPAEMQIQDLNRVIHASLALVRHELVQHDIDLDLDLAAQPAEVALDRGKMQQVFINLFMNAIQAMGRGGVLSVRTVPGRLDDTQDPGSHTPDWFHAGDPIVVAEVADTGCGISENKVNKIFDPFFTTKPTGQGTGLGLSVTQTIARQHKAILTIQNRKRQRGVMATLTFKAIGGK
jgi:signal transduction histidine kinase